MFQIFLGGEPMGRGSLGALALGVWQGAQWWVLLSVSTSPMEWAARGGLNLSFSSMDPPARHTHEKARTKYQ